MYRAVFLMGPPERLDLLVKFIYRLALNSDGKVTLSVIAQDLTQVECGTWALNSEDPIQTVRNLMYDHEWRARKSIFSEAISKLPFSPTVPAEHRDIAKVQLDKVLATPQSLVDVAKNINMRKQSSSTSRTWMAVWFDEPAAITLIGALKSAAEEILKRRTILLTPTDLEKSLRPRAREFVCLVAVELHKSMRADAANLLNVGFLQYVPPPPSPPIDVETQLAEEFNQVPASLQKPKHLKRTPDTFDLLGTLVREMQIQTSIGLLRRGDDYAKAGPILLEGRTGTGKSLAAALIARNLKRPLVSINIAAVTPTLLESRMRGYNKGAFTGAITDVEGWFEQANDKVLFLDEVQSADIPSQTQLLDLLSAVSDDITVSRMGQDSKTSRYRVKVVLAINEPIELLIKAGRLREDLYHRIRSVIHFPPLKDLLGETANENPQASGKTFLTSLLFIYRWKAAPCLYPSKDDNSSNLRNMAALFPSFAPGTIDRMVAHSWEGNFRELERFAFDLYWRLDKSASQGEVTLKMVDDDLLATSQRMRSQPILEVGSQGEENLNVVLHHIERCLRNENFVIDRVLPHLVPFNIKTRSKLRKYLLEHVDKLSLDVQKERAVRAFLKLGEAG